MTTLLWIGLGGVLMSAIALVGSVTLVLPPARLERLILPLVALAAGTLLGGALFHMLPAAVEALGNTLSIYGWVALGFVACLALEQFLHWHHCHRPGTHHRPLSVLILIADALHNFVGGLAVAGAFLIDVRVGVSAWLAAAAHEIPQELGDFGILLHAGWKSGRALLYNLLSASTFLVGGLVAYSASQRFDVTFLLPFAAGNFVYIAAADLIPEIRQEQSLARSALHFAAFAAGLALLLGVRLAFHD